MREAGFEAWVAFLTGPLGAVCMVSVGTLDDPHGFERVLPSDEMMHHPTPTASGQGLWQTTLFTRGSVRTEEAELARYVHTGRIVPPANLPGLTPEVGSPSGLGFLPEPLMTEMLANGWHRLTGPASLSLVGNDVGLDGGRTQVVFFGCPTPGVYEWATGVARDPARYAELVASGIQIPEHYTVDAPADANSRALLKHQVTTSVPPELSAVNDFAVDFAAYADGIEKSLWGGDEL